MAEEKLEDDMPEGENVELEDDNTEVEDTEDGGAVIRLENEEDERKNLAHFANIVEEVDPDMLKEAVTDLLEKIDKDKEAREKRDKQYEEGLRRTGLGDDAPGRPAARSKARSSVRTTARSWPRPSVKPTL